MVDFTPKETRPEKKDDLEEILESQQSPKQAEEQAETPDEDLLEIIEKYQGRLAEPSENVDYEQEEEKLYLSGNEAGGSYSCEGESADVSVESEAPSIVSGTQEMDAWLRVHTPEDFEYDGPVFASPKAQQDREAQ